MSERESLFEFRRWLAQARHTVRLRFHKTHSWRGSFDVEVCWKCGAMRARDE